MRQTHSYILPECDLLYCLRPNAVIRQLSRLYQLVDLRPVDRGGPHEEQAQRALVSEEDGHEEINAGGGGSEANAPPSASLATAPEARGPSAQVPAAVADADTAVLDSCDLPPMIVNPDSFLYDESGTYVWSVERVKAAWAEAKKAWAFYLELQPKRAVLLMGMPGSGKSTWLAANQRPNVVYFDATFDSAWKRKFYIESARAAGIPVEIVWLDTPLKVCRARNRQRPTSRRVPEDVLRRMAGLIREAPPTADEGATVTRVKYQPFPIAQEERDEEDDGGEWTYV